MSSIDDVLDRYSYAETIKHTLPTSEVTIEVAEAHLTRNKEFGKVLNEIISRPGRAEPDADPDDPGAELGLKLSFAEEVELFCRSLLKGWDAGIPIERSQEVFLHKDDENDKRGENFYREAVIVTRLPSAFAKAPGKKKPSPKPGSRKSASAKSRPSSASKRKTAAKPSRKRSRTTTKPTSPG